MLHAAADDTIVSHPGVTAVHDDGGLHAVYVFGKTSVALVFVHFFFAHV